MIKNRCFPYNETSFRLVQANLLEISTPWFKTELTIPNHLVNELRKGNREAYSMILKKISFHPICNIRPRSFAVKDLTSVNLEKSITTSLIPTISHVTWDVGKMLHQSKIGLSGFYDPLALFSIIRREIHRVQNVSTFTQRATLYANIDEGALAKLSILYLTQCYFALHNSIDCFDSAMKHSQIKEVISGYITEHGGVDTLVRSAILELMQASVDSPTPYTEIRAAMGAFKYLSDNHPLGFAMASYYFDKVVHEEVKPLSNLLRQTKDYKKSAIHLSKYLDQSKKAKREFAPFRMLNAIGPTNKNGAIAAIVSMHNLFALFNRIENKILHQSEFLIKHRKTLVLLKKGS